MGAGLRLGFLGASGEVTGSRFLVESPSGRVLLDCGLFQGHRHEALEKNRDLPFDPAALAAVLLSHAHIDHSGGLPLLAKRGLTGPIHATPATAELCAVMLMDSARLQEEDAKFFNKLHAAEGRRIEPLYGAADAAACLSLIREHPYQESFPAAAGTRARFLNSGHVLGSALVELELGGRRIAFTGDLGRRRSLLLPPPQRPENVDYLIVESTYGGRRHPAPEDARARLLEVLRRTVEEKGRLLIPCFALERTQEVLFILQALRRSGQAPGIPVFVDSPMAAEATAVFERHRAGLRLDGGDGGDPFGLESVRFLASAEESKALNDRPGPWAVIAGSGMCEGGRILHHLRNALEEDSTTVLLMGYQAEGTLGRRLQDGAKKVKIFGLEHEVWAKVESIQSLSAHADQDDLVAFVKSLEPRPRRIFVVHGEEGQRKALQERLRAEGIERVTLPSFKETLTLD